MRGVILLAAVTLISGLGAPVRADDVKALTKTVAQLVSEGYQLHSVTIMDQAVARRMSRDDSWQDNLLLTFVKGGDFAFCNLAMNVVTTGIGLKNAICNVAQ